MTRWSVSGIVLVELDLANSSLSLPISGVRLPWVAVGTQLWEPMTFMDDRFARLEGC